MLLSMDGKHKQPKTLQEAITHFSDPDNATLAYTVDTQSATKSLTRFVFSNPKTACK